MQTKQGACDQEDVFLQTQPHKVPILTVTDASRFGSTLAGKKFQNSTKDVNTGDEIQFGCTAESKFK